MAKRKRPIDDRWERTTGNLIVPRKPSSRRFIGKNGSAQNCCEESCDPCRTDPPNTTGVWVNIFPSSCPELSGDWWLPYVRTTTRTPSWSVYPMCRTEYEDEFDGVYFHAFLGQYLDQGIDNEFWHGVLISETGFLADPIIFGAAEGHADHDCSDYPFVAYSGGYPCTGNATITE